MHTRSRSRGDQRMWGYFILIGLTLSSTNAKASWLSEITGVDIDLNRGTVTVKPPNILAIPEMIQNLPKDVGQALLNPAAPVLATAIRFSRGQALNRGAQPIPSYVRNALAPHFPPNILDKVRWTTAGGGLTLDAALANWFNQEGAITLDDVIVFSNNQMATNDNADSLKLWAHELTHVMQYQTMGVEQFAFTYTVGWEGLEGQARDNAQRVASLLNSSPLSPAVRTYSAQPGAFSSQISWPQVNQTARQAINPSSCIWIDNGMTGNNCPIPIMVSGIVMVNSSGQQIQYPCNEPTCFFPPGASGPLLSPPGYQVIGVSAAYQVN